jgi:hypothetical protein
MNLTMDTLGNSLIALGISYVVVICFSIYQLYLNWKQAKVSNQMIELVHEVKETNHALTIIITLLEEKRGRKK